jgi:hypothetical protein
MKDSIPNSGGHSILRKTLAYATEGRERLTRNIHHTAKLLPEMRRKPALVRHWLLSARKAQVALLVALLLLPSLVPAGFDRVLESIYPPLTSQHVFGLLTKTIPDPRLEDRQQLVRLLLWGSAAALVMGLFWLHIPKAMSQAQRRARELESEADSVPETAPSRSAMLYREAAALVTDRAREAELQRKLEQVGRQYGEEIDAVRHAAGGSNSLAKPPDVPPESTLVTPGSQRPGLPVASLGADGRYVLETVLGRGAMGVVYRARDLRLDRPVALKQLFSHGAGDEEMMRRFHQEARVLARLSHPNIVQVYDFIEGGQGAWIAMELVEGEDLEWALSRGALSITDVVRRGSELADALGYAHAKGVIHRDFKPANVLMDNEDCCKISDFGIAKLSESSVHTQAGTVLGSPAYMSPEQANGSSVDARADIYALGVTLFHMVTGRPPFRGDTQSVLAQVLTQEPPSPRNLNKSCPKALEALILSMMAKAPGERPQTMAEVKATLTSS